MEWVKLAEGCLGVLQQRAALAGDGERSLAAQRRAARWAGAGREGPGQCAPAQPAPLARFGCSSTLCDLDSPWIPSHGCGKLRARSAPFLVYPLNLTCKCPSWQLGGQFDSGEVSPGG